MSYRISWLLVMTFVVVGISAGFSTGRMSAQAIAACPSGATVSVAPPTAAAPATVTTTITPGQNIKAASVGDAQSLHVHYFIDTAPAAAGAVIPTGDPKIIHSGSLTQDLGALSAGSHTVTVVVGQLNHTACEARGAVTFTVAQAITATATAAASPAAPKTGSAGLLPEDSSPVAVAFAVLTVAALVGGARLVTRRG